MYKRQLRTDEGWLVLYHGVSDCGKGYYRVGALLLDLENPLKILGKTRECILEPETAYETEGFYKGCVFPTGNVIVNGILYVYYGAGDRYVCLLYTSKVTRDLSISVDLAGRFEKIGEAAAGDYIFTTVINSKPTERPYVPDSVEPGGLGSNGLNLSPIGQAEQGGYHRVENSVFNGTLSATYEFPFVKGLKIRGRFSYCLLYTSRCV